MSALEFTVQSFTANELAIKVKNISGASLDKTLTIEIYPPMYLVSAAVNDAAIKAASNEQPQGAMRLDGIVSGPQGWSIWARRESSDSTLIIVLINDRDQNTGAELSDPIKFPAGAESIIRIPLNPEATQGNVDLSYSYTHDDPEARVDGKLELKSTQEKDVPVVTLTTDAKNPTMINAGDLVQVKWKIPNGVSAILRGPLPGDNSELTLSSDPAADFKIAEGSLTIRVVGLMNYLLQAEVKRDGKPNLQVVKMLTLDTSNKKHLYLGARQGKVLPYGLIEMDWAAWGVPQVVMTAGDTTRVIKLTQQTFGGSFEGSGVMRFSAGKTGSETILIEAKPESKSKSVLVSSWQHMTKPDITGHPYALAVSAPKIGLLTSEGLYIADVGKLDPSPALKKLMFKKAAVAATEWFALTALGNRFFCLTRKDPNIEVVSFTLDGAPEAIPPLALPMELSRILMAPRVAIDFVGFGDRIYIVADLPARGDYGGRRAYSVGFDWNNKKASYRPEPLLESLIGYSLVTFDDALYALNRDTGRMFRFELTKAGALGPALQAASAVRKEKGEEKSMIRDGLLVPVGRVLVVLSPTSVPTLNSLEEYDLHNVLNYESTSPTDDSIPQDLVYNPQKNYWARCGHDLDVKKEAIAAFRNGDSPRMWVVQPDGETHTLPVGSESLFVRDYVLDFPTKPLPPYFDKKRKFTIKSFSAIGPIEEKYRKQHITDVETPGLRDVSPLPTRPQVQFDVEIGYHQADPGFVRLTFQLPRRPQQRADVDYLLEVRFLNENLSTAVSTLYRASIVEGRFSYDIVSGGLMEHTTDSIIEVKRPARLDEHLRFVIVNASEQFRLKPDKVLPGGPAYILDEAFLPINHDTPDFSLKFDGRIATEGVIGVNLNFALDLGIEASTSKERQRNMIRLNTDNAQKMQVLLVKTLMPGDAPLKLKGSNQLIEPMTDRPVLVCHLDYKM
jgi:hypothetical protein